MEMREAGMRMAHTVIMTRVQAVTTIEYQWKIF